MLTHHRRSGSFLSQTQEEVVLIAAFGLMWFGTQPCPLARTHIPYRAHVTAVLLGWRAFQQRGIDPGEAANTDMASATGRTSNRYNEGFTPGKRPYPCRSDSVYCVVEEWTYW